MLFLMILHKLAPLLKLPERMLISMYHRWCILVVQFFLEKKRKGKQKKDNDS